MAFRGHHRCLAYPRFTGAGASPGQAAEGTLSGGSEPVQEKVRVEGERLVDPLPLHHGERHAVDEAE